MGATATIEVKSKIAAQLLGEISRLKSDMEAKTSNLSEAQLNWKPDPKSWSVAEVLEHLIKTDKTYESPLRQAAEKAKKENIKEQKPHESTWLGKWFIDFIKPKENMRKLKAPGVLAPSNSRYDAGIVTRYQENLNALERALTGFDGYDFNKLKITSGISSLIRFNLGDYFIFTIQHHLRHSGQIDRLLKRPEFPKS